MLKRAIWLGLAVGLAPGCTYLSATPSVQGHAYVVRNEYISSSYWNCDALSGEPICYQTKKQPLPPAQAAK
jgi:hypothetical protein